MPELAVSDSGCRVLMLPKSALQDASEEGNLKIIRLKRPKNEEPGLYLFNAQTNKIYEIMSFAEEERSWFIGDRVVGDGSLMLSTPIDPTFLILPSLMSAERNMPLEDQLDDPDYPHLNHLASMCTGLGNVANQLGDPSLNVWKYDEEKCLSWLESKVQAVKKVLEEQKVDPSGGAPEYATDMPTEYLRYSLGIISEYISPSLSDKLEQKLNLPAPSVKRKQSVEGDQASKRYKTEDMENEPKVANVKKPTAKPKEKSAKQKSLEKSAIGTSSITSFFKAKPK